MKSVATLVTLAFLVSMFELGQPQNIWPDSFCSYLAYRFRKEGCLNNESLFCKIMAFKFNAKLGNRAFCPQFTCQGYNTVGHQCKGLFSCPFGRIRTKGICPLNKFCCVDPA